MTLMTSVRYAWAWLVWALKLVVIFGGIGLIGYGIYANFGWGGLAVAALVLGVIGWINERPDEAAMLFGGAVTLAIVAAVIVGVGMLFGIGFNAVR